MFSIRNYEKPELEWLNAHGNSETMVGVCLSPLSPPWNGLGSLDPCSGAARLIGANESIRQPVGSDDFLGFR